MRARKIDSNQNQVVKQLRRIPGVSVSITSGIGKGFPDLVIGFRNSNFLIELKDGDKVPSARKLTTDESLFAATWRGQITTCNNFDEVLKVLMK